MNIFEKEQQYFVNIYKRFPINVEKGRGVYLFDKDGTCYLDLLSGIAVNALGYHHPAIESAIKKQLDRNLHLSNFFIQDIQIELAEKLLEITPFSKIFFSNSGTEAIEGLLKLVKKWGNQEHKNEIVAFEGSFHGRSLGALSITIQDKYQKNYQPLLPNIKVVPFNDVDAFRSAVSDKTAAVFYEGITGEGGIRPVAGAMYKAMKELREKHGFLIISDEIQTGAGRTGSFYYFEQSPLIPDAIASAKGLGGGMPLGAFLLNDKLKDVFQRGDHGTTYGGNPLACAAGLAAVSIIGNQNFLDSVQKRGVYFKNKLYELQNEFSEIISDVRGTGLMLGMEVRNEAPKIMEAAIEKGIIFNIAGGNTLRFVPPLIIDSSEIDEGIEKLRLIFKQLF